MCFNSTLTEIMDDNRSGVLKSQDRERRRIRFYPLKIFTLKT